MKFKDKNCKNCEKDYKPTSSRSLYCSDDCYRNAKIKRMTKWRRDSREHIRKYRSKNQAAYLRKYRKENPDKERSRWMVAEAIKSGKLVREPCVECGEKKVHGHHEDYSKHLEVIWLCQEHHADLHRNKEKPQDIPMGVSQWRAHGKKYGYDKFFEDKEKPQKKIDLKINESKAIKDGNIMNLEEWRMMKIEEVINKINKV